MSKDFDYTIERISKAREERVDESVERVRLEKSLFFLGLDHKILIYFK